MSKFQATTEDLAYSVPDGGKAIGVGTTQMYQLINSGALPARKLGRRTFILKSDLEQFLSSLETYPTQGGK